MRRRRTLIDEYLREHDPVPMPDRGQAPAPVRPARRRSTQARSGLLAAGVTAVVLVTVVALLPSRATRGAEGFLTAEAAVAAVADGFDRDGILHWTFRTGSAGKNGPILDEWVDLRTHATYTIFPPQKRSALGVGPTKLWYNGQRTYRSVMPPWTARAPDGRRIVRRQVRRRGEKIPDAVKTTPITELRDLLDAARRGEAKLLPAPDEGGVPVVRVQKRTANPQGTWTETTWMTRESVPRLLRTLNRFEPTDGGRQVTELIVAVNSWELLPRTPENIAKVQPPAFDPAKFKVNTQFLGPRKR